MSVFLVCLLLENNSHVLMQFTNHSSCSFYKSNNSIYAAVFGG